MNLYFMPTAAAEFVRLDEPALGAVVAELNRNAPSRKAQLPKTPEVVCRVNTASGDLWLGAFVELDDLTLVTLGEVPPEHFRKHVEDLLRAKRRLALGGVSLTAKAGEIRDTIQTLLEEQKAYYALCIDALEKDVTLEPVTVHPMMAPVASQVARSADRWRSTPARQDFKTVMEKAAVTPQVIEREDGREVVVIDRQLLERFEQPYSGAALAGRFAKNDLPYLNFNESLETEPNPVFELPSRA